MLVVLVLPLLEEEGAGGGAWVGGLKAAPRGVRTNVQGGRNVLLGNIKMVCQMPHPSPCLLEKSASLLVCVRICVCVGMPGIRIEVWLHMQITSVGSVRVFLRAPRCCRADPPPPLFSGTAYHNSSFLGG